MPPGNLTQMTDEERKQLGAWIAAGAPVSEARNSDLVGQF